MCTFYYQVLLWFAPWKSWCILKNSTKAEKRGESWATCSAPGGFSRPAVTFLWSLISPSIMFWPSKSGTAVSDINCFCSTSDSSLRWTVDSRIAWRHSQQRIITSPIFSDLSVLILSSYKSLLETYFSIWLQSFPLWTQLLWAMFCAKWGAGTASLEDNQFKLRGDQS